MPGLPVVPAEAVVKPIILFVLPLIAAKPAVGAPVGLGPPPAPPPPAPEAIPLLLFEIFPKPSSAWVLAKPDPPLSPPSPPKAAK
jgi:hypothetical protein